MSEARVRARRGNGAALRPEILDAAKRLLADAADADAVSIRAVADAAGVTAPAIYLHFADKVELMSAVVAEVFVELDAAMVAAAEPETTALGRLRAFGLAYVRFAVEHPEHYRIATMVPCAVPSAAVDRVLASSAFVHFRTTVEQCMAEGVFAAGDVVGVTLELWTAAHGVASLLVAKPYLPWGDVDAFAERVLGTAALGHAAGGLLGAAPGPESISSWLHAQRGQGEGR